MRRQVRHPNFRPEGERPVCCHHRMGIEADPAGRPAVMELLAVPRCDAVRDTAAFDRGGELLKRLLVSMMGHARMPMFPGFDRVTVGSHRHVFRRSLDAGGMLSSVRAYFLGEGRCGIRAQGNQT